MIDTLKYIFNKSNTSYINKTERNERWLEGLPIKLLLAFKGSLGNERDEHKKACEMRD